MAAKATPEDLLSRADEALKKLDTKNRLLVKELAAMRTAYDAADSKIKLISGLHDLVPDPPKWLIEKRDPKLPGVPMTFWSDWHGGEIINKAQTGGANEFTHAIMKERVYRLVSVLLDLSKHHMVNPDYPGIVVCLGGDMISGFIHDELRETNEGPIQTSLLLVEELLIWALDILVAEFGRVFVSCVVGNHGRGTIKRRAKNAIEENFDWLIYKHLQRHYQGDDRIQFQIPSDTDAYFSVLGHRFLLTHGDHLGVRGGDGIIGALGPIARGAIKVGRSEAQIGRDFDTLLMGHWHTYIPRGDATSALVNGCLCGYNEYARLELRVPYSRPSQSLWFVHGQHGYTATWPIYLDKLRKSDIDFGREWVSWEQRRK